MNKLINKNIITTKELAETLGVDKRTINETIQRLLSEKVLSHLVKISVKGGYTWSFTEGQATIIKQEIQKHHNLANRQIDTVTTEEEENQIVQKAISILNFRAEEFRRRAELAESQLLEQKPKVEFYDDVTGSTDTIEMKEVAKVLNCEMGRNKLFEFLRNRKVLDRNNQPYQQYVDNGYFRVIESKFTTPDGDIKINLKTVVFQKGLAYIRNLLKDTKYIA